MNSDPNFAIYRRFGWLRKRVLLHCQTELDQLEAELRTLDVGDQMNGNLRIGSNKLDNQQEGSRRPELLRTIEVQLRKYGKFPLVLPAGTIAWRYEDITTCHRPSRSFAIGSSDI